MLNFNQFFESKNSGIKKYKLGDFDVSQGKDAESNDYLTFYLSKDDDLWFHAKGFPGSHVVLHVNNGILPTEEIIKKVALIAAKNSKCPKDGSCTVVFCKRKFVTKGPEFAAGKVIVDHRNSNEIEVKNLIQNFS
jgi:predicted ribosome quality control (RQC) complex YloA/Tae2 family protein